MKRNYWTEHQSPDPIGAATEYRKWAHERMTDMLAAAGDDIVLGREVIDEIMAFTPMMHSSKPGVAEATRRNTLNMVRGVFRSVVRECGRWNDEGADNPFVLVPGHEDGPSAVAYLRRREALAPSEWHAVLDRERTKRRKAQENIRYVEMRLGIGAAAKR